MIKFKDILTESAINNYLNSKNKILVGKFTNLLRDMNERYDIKQHENLTYYFDNGYHFATQEKIDSFIIIYHDGSLDEYGWRKRNKGTK